MGGPLKEREMLEGKKVKQVRTKRVEPLEEKDMLGDEKVKQLRTYTGVFSTRRATG